MLFKMEDNQTGVNFFKDYQDKINILNGRRVPMTEQKGST